MKMLETTYRSSDAAKAAGVTQFVLNEWVKRGLIRPAIPAPGQGASAVWDFKSVVLVRLMKLLVDAGMRRNDAGKIVSSNEVSTMFDGAIKKTVVKWTGKGLKAISGPSLLGGISNPVWMVVALCNGNVIADWYRDEAEREAALKSFEDAEVYTTLNLAAVINKIYMRLPA